MRIRCTIVATALVLALSGVARAGTLVTPPLLIHDVSADWVMYQAVNIGKKTRDIIIKCFDGNSAGSAFPTGWTTCPDVKAGEMCGGGGSPWVGPVYCKISFKGSKKNVRASASVIKYGPGSVPVYIDTVSAY